MIEQRKELIFQLNVIGSPTYLKGKPNEKSDTVSIHTLPQQIDDLILTLKGSLSKMEELDQKIE